MISTATPSGACRVLPLLLALIVGACQAPAGDRPDAAADVPEPAPEALYFEALGAGPAARTDTVLHAVARDSAAWAALRARLPLRHAFGAVDFDQMMVVAAAVPVDVGGSHLAFEAFERDAEGVLAHYVLALPSANCLAIPGATTPFQAVAVRRTDAPVRFEATRETLPCRVRQR